MTKVMHFVVKDQVGDIRSKTMDVILRYFI